jgi:hypothetical protein
VAIRTSGPRAGKAIHKPHKEISVATLARGYTELAIRTLGGIAQNGTSESARVAACMVLLDRGWGKAAPARPTDAGQMPMIVEIVYRQREPRPVLELKPNGSASPAAPA